MKLLTTSAALAALLLCTGAASADSALEHGFSARSLGMGASLRGAATGSAAALNPAGAALVKAYAVEGSYGYRADDGETQLNASAADSTTRVAMNIYYAYAGAAADIMMGTGLGQLDRTRHEIGAATAIPVSDRFALGLTPKYTRANATVYDPAAQTTTTVVDKSRFNLDVGGVVALAPRLTLGVVGYNLLAHDTDYPRAVGGGLAFGFGQSALLSLDGLVDLTSSKDAGAGSEKRVRISGGAELVLANQYPIRGGAIWQSFDGSTYLTGGVGYQSPRVGLDLAIRQKVRGGDETAGLVALKFYLPTQENAPDME